MLRFLMSLLLGFAVCTPALVAGGLVEFLDGVIPEAPPNAKVLAGYGRIRNATDGPLRIYAASSPDFARVEFHRTSMRGGVMHMEELGRFAVPVGGFVEFRRGGLHLMLFEPKRPLRDGDKVRIDFSYASPQPMVATFDVKRAIP